MKGEDYSHTDVLTGCKARKRFRCEHIYSRGRVNGMKAYSAFGPSFITSVWRIMSIVALMHWEKQVRLT